MQNSVHYQIVFFFRFMRLFRISFFSLRRTEPDRIYAIVAWEEDCRNGIPDPEDVQEVLWMWETDSDVDDALAAGEYACQAGWISADRVKIDELRMQQHLGWDSARSSRALQKLFQMRARMIDDGKETDAFLLHD